MTCIVPGSIGDLRFEILSFPQVSNFKFQAFTVQAALNAALRKVSLSQ